MDKVRKFLEAYVQWLAVALGVGFLGWMIYDYVVLKPAASTVGSNQSVSPAEVDRTVWDGPGQSLTSQISSSTLPPPMGPQEDLADTVKAGRDKVADGIAMNLPVPWTPLPVPQDTGAGIVDNHGNVVAKITRLPEAPPLIKLATSGGHSNVQPILAVGAAAPSGTAALPLDVTWETVEGTFPVIDLAKSFAAAGIQPGTNFSSTCTLRVVLQRQERKIDGTWPASDDDCTVVDPIDPASLQPLPDIRAPWAAQKDYIEGFAEKSQVAIAQPPFYQVVSGNVWYEPGTMNPNDSGDLADDGYDPKNPGAFTGDVDKLLPSEKALVLEARDAKAKSDAARSKNQQNRNQPSHQLPPGFPGGGFPGRPGAGGGGGGGGGPGGGGGRNGLDDDPQRPPAGSRGFPGPYGMPPGFGRFPGRGGPPPGFGGRQPQQQQSGPNNLPTGSFDPSSQLVFKVWAHDVTAKAGKTYRYKMKYIISNPVARSSGLCNPQTLADIFYIESKTSVWTDPVNVESDTSFYATDFKHGIHFDVFKLKGGIWEREGVDANPGDMVGTILTNSTTGAKTDFTTGWTLVDVREDPSNSDNRTLVLVSNNGTVLRKELISDAHSPEYRKHYLQAMEASKTASAAGSANATQ